MTSPDPTPRSRAECLHLSRKVLACLDALAPGLPAPESQRLRLAAAHLQSVIELLDQP